MAKIILRVFLILLVAALVSGGLMLWLNNSGSSLSAALGIMEGGFKRNGPRGYTQPGQKAEIQPGQAVEDQLGQLPGRPAGGFEGQGGRHGESIQVGRGLADLLQKIGIIALITAGVAILQRLVGRITRRKRSAPSAI